jgi:hypothetical protein
MIRIATMLAVLFGLAGIAVVFLLPAMAAYVCPPCFGLMHVDEVVYAEKNMNPSAIETLRSAVIEAEDRVRGFYGSFDRKPTLLVCMTEACDRRLGGKGAKARAFGSTFVHVSPRGRNGTILSHEFSHIELHRRVGDTRLARGHMPAWFDEGVAVIVSRDSRYLEIGGSGELRCRVEPEGRSPSGRAEWGAAAGQKDRPLYAMAACRTLRWMKMNGGRQGVLTALASIKEGEAVFEDLKSE